ncbi:MAG: CoA transferase [Synergistaceae bacterium]|jgi:crotonobetainyl-CoA:carnitine CoA-transferase CaiB-like acyl-CoA transferase|nr:CoA transferase [Synergistaceae bacterium]
MNALEGIKVLDLTRLLPGPFATMFLADFGAEVIKVEQPGEGDYARGYEPMRGDRGYRFLIINRNKKSLTLDLKKPEGKEIFRKLARNADVVIESFRPGVMKKLGLDYEALSELNPRLVFCSLSGYGQTGPYRMEAGHDLNYVGSAGIPSLTGKPTGDPVIPGIQIADLAGGLMAVIGILVALQGRGVTGRGQQVDASLFSAAIAMLPADASVLFGGGGIPTRGEGRLTGGWPHYNIYRTKDGRYLACGALEKKFWKNLCGVLGREDLSDAIDDKKNFPALKNLLESTFREHTLNEWLQKLEGRETCITPIKNLDEVFEDPHVVENELVVDVEDAELGRYRQLGQPIKLSETPGRLETTAPKLGEHNEKILTELGYTKEEIASFSRNGII